MAEETIEDYKKKVSVLEQKLSVYESNGAAKLFYSLNRKMNEMADIMNDNKLSDLNLEDPKDKTFERLKIIWNDSSNIALAVKALGETAGVTGDEMADTNKRTYKQRTTPETIADVLKDT